MNFCCNNMKYFIEQNPGENPFISDNIILYVKQFDEYGIIVHDSGESYITISHCPWCGKKLPDSKRDLWFDELEKMGIENPLEDDIPIEFKSDIWWKQLIDEC